MARRIIKEDEPFINEEFNNRIDWIIDDVLLRDDTWKEWEHDLDRQEQMHLSELGRICQNFSKTDFAAVCITAFENYPMMYIADSSGRDPETKGRGK